MQPRWLRDGAGDTRMGCTAPSTGKEVERARLAGTEVEPKPQQERGIGRCVTK
jgi:hypothetical protein